MTSQEKDLKTVIPNLRNIPVYLLSELSSSALFHSIALYLDHLKQNVISLSSFQSII